MVLLELLASLFIFSVPLSCCLMRSIYCLILYFSCVNSSIFLYSYIISSLDFFLYPSNSYLTCTIFPSQKLFSLIFTCFTSSISFNSLSLNYSILFLYIRFSFFVDSIIWFELVSCSMLLRRVCDLALLCSCKISYFCW